LLVSGEEASAGCFELEKIFGVSSALEKDLTPHGSKRRDMQISSLFVFEPKIHAVLVNGGKRTQGVMHRIESQSLFQILSSIASIHDRKHGKRMKPIPARVYFGDYLQLSPDGKLEGNMNE